MLDPKYVRDNIEYMKKIAKDRLNNVDLDLWAQKYDQLKEIKFQIEEVNAAKNQAAKDKNFEAGKNIKAKSQELETQYANLEPEFMELSYQIPNLYSPDVPHGKDDSENVVIRQVGDIKSFTFRPKEHWDIAEKR